MVLNGCSRCQMYLRVIENGVAEAEPGNGSTLCNRTGDIAGWLAMQAGSFSYFFSNSR